MAQILTLYVTHSFRNLFDNFYSWNNVFKWHKIALSELVVVNVNLVLDIYVWKQKKNLIMVSFAVIRILAGDLQQDCRSLGQVKEKLQLRLLIYFFRPLNSTDYQSLHPYCSQRLHITDRLCGLVVRVLGYRSGGPGSIPGTNRKKVVGLERGPLSLVSTTQELLDRKKRLLSRKPRIRP
jgi:hypothetical protein